MTKPTCKHPNCPKEARTTGLCHTHYMRSWRAHGQQQQAVNSPEHAARRAQLDKQYEMRTSLAGTDRKWCSRCDTVRERSEFSRSRVSGDGLQSWCKSCHAVRHQEQRQQRGQAGKQQETAGQQAGPQGQEQAA